MYECIERIVPSFANVVGSMFSSQGGHEIAPGETWVVISENNYGYFLIS